MDWHGWTGFPVHHQLPELTHSHVHWVGDAIQPSHPLSSPSPPAFNLSKHQGFSKESVLHIRWPEYWSFSFRISPSSEYSELISFRIDWLDLLAVQGTLKSLLQHHSSKASILCSAFFMVQLSHPYMITGKAITLAGWTFVGKVMSLLVPDYYFMIATFSLVLLSLLMRKKMKITFLSPSTKLLPRRTPVQHLASISQTKACDCVTWCVQVSLESLPCQPLLREIQCPLCLGRVFDWKPVLQEHG